MSPSYRNNSTDIHKQGGAEFLYLHPAAPIFRQFYLPANLSSLLQLAYVRRLSFFTGALLKFLLSRPLTIRLFIYISKDGFDLILH